METGLVRIAEIARQNPKERFTALIHHINQETLIECHQMVSGSKASGVDQVTKQAYGENLEANIADLIGRMKRQAYKPQPVRRVYIPKEGSNKMRPLGIPSYEDKLVQKGLARILNTIYEQDFLDCSFGFRPGRGCHDALKVLNHIIERKKVNYIVDADIRGFFDHVDHEWLMKFLELRIADPNLLRLIKRFLKAGVMEAGIVYDTPEGTPQAFQWADLPTHHPTCLDALFHPCASPILLRHPFAQTQAWWHWILNQLSIPYAFRPRVRSRLTLGGRAFPRNP